MGLNGLLVVPGGEKNEKKTVEANGFGTGEGSKQLTEDKQVDGCLEKWVEQLTWLNQSIAKLSKSYEEKRQVDLKGVQTKF